MTTPHPIVQEIATRKGVSPTELPPLTESVDLDAVNDVIDAPRDSNASVEFDYTGYYVSIVAEGEVVIEESSQ